MSIVFEVLMLAGALGLFLYGMKMMSDGLQKVSGEKMRAILGTMTSNPLKCVFTGFMVTAVIQSSSATTVMIVSFANAGLLTLVQAIGVIMGANIGTTVTAWIISLLGLNMDMAMFAIPFIAIGFPLLMLKSRRNKSLGELIIGFALLFMGLDALKGAVPDIRSNLQILEFLQNYSQSGFVSVVVFVFIGTILTMVLQSSSATMALTLVMCTQGLPFEIAVGMVMGENIGTTITANLAATVANARAKRAARAHLIFNMIGVIWALILFHPFLKLIVWIMGLFNSPSPYESVASVTIALSLFHTLFNFLNTCLLLGFTPQIAKLTGFMVKQKNKEDDTFRLKYIQRGMMSTAELSLAQAKMEILLYAKLVTKQFGMVRELFAETNSDKFDEFYKRVEHYEEISDRMELEIATYLNKIGEVDLSEESSRRLEAMYRAITEIESVGDSNYSLARILQRKKDYSVHFDQYLRGRITEMLDILERAFDCMNENLEKGDEPVANISGTYEHEKQLNDKRTLLKEEHVRNLEENKYKYIAGVIYMDLVSECEHMGDFLVNVSETTLG